MALAMLILFLVLGLAGRVVLQYRITGDHGLRPVQSSSSAAAKLASGLLAVVSVVTLALCILDAMGTLRLQLNLGAGGAAFGVALCVGGIFVTLLSQYQMGASWRLGVDELERTRLITHGIYSVVRNPIYTGVMIFGVGIEVLVPSVHMVITMILGYVSIELQVRRVEEPYLQRLHGEAFSHYVARTGRYWPRLRSVA